MGLAERSCRRKGRTRFCQAMTLQVSLVLELHVHGGWIYSLWKVYSSILLSHFEVVISGV